MKINFKQSFYLSILLFGVYFFCLNNIVFANDFSSSNFVVKDPVFSEGAEYSTSQNFGLWSSVSQNAVGLSTSASNQLKSGFLYFITSTSSGSSSSGSSNGGGSIFFSPGDGFSYPVGSGGGEISPPKQFNCSKIVDLNCDGRVNLKDLSILFSEPKDLSIKFMSLILAGWTEKLPAPTFALEPKTVKVSAKSSNLDLGLAQFESAISSTSQKIKKIQTSVTRSFLGFIKALGSFILKILRF